MSSPEPQPPHGIEPNPYQPPLMPESERGRRVLAGEAFTRWPKGLAIFTLALVAIASGAYLAFIGTMFDRSPLDRIVGCFYLLNVPMLGLWMFRLATRRSNCFQAGAIVVGIQLLILLVMVSTGLGQFRAVLRINMLIAVGFAILALQCYLVVRVAAITSAREAGR